MVNIMQSCGNRVYYSTNLHKFYGEFSPLVDFWGLWVYDTETLYFLFYSK